MCLTELVTFDPCSPPRPASLKSFTCTAKPASIGTPQRRWVHKVITVLTAFIVYHNSTGEVSGSYVMQFQNQSFAEVLAFDDSVEPRPITGKQARLPSQKHKQPHDALTHMLHTDEAKHGLEWYALYVELALGNPSPKYAC